MSIIETIAVIFGLLCVLLTIRQNIWCWPTGLIQVALYIYIFYQVKLYSDLILHIIYVGLQVYGWYHWLWGGQNKTVLKVTQTPPAKLAAWIFTTFAGTLSWGWFMSRMTDASVPYGDAFTTVVSLCAQWLMAQKKLESWLFWISVDIVAVGIYYSKDLYMTSGLYAVFMCMAIVGYLSWRKTLPGK